MHQSARGCAFLLGVATTPGDDAPSQEPLKGTGVERLHDPGSQPFLSTLR